MLAQISALCPRDMNPAMAALPMRVTPVMTMTMITVVALLLVLGPLIAVHLMVKA